MNLRKLLLAGVLSTSVLVGSTTIASAGEFGSSLEIDVKPTTVNVTIPSSAPMVFNEDGTDTLPSNFTMKNNSKIGGISLREVALTSPENTWSLLAEEADLRIQPKDQKKIKLHVGKPEEEKLVAPTSNASIGSAKFNLGEISIPATGSETLKFKVERGTFSQPVTNSTAFNMVLTFEFN